MKKLKNFNVEYDSEGDILYITRGGLTKEDISNEMGDDVIIWKNKISNEVSGFTVLNLSKRTAKKPVRVKFPFEVDFHIPQTLT
ncbi:MAG: hypothetical protein G01um101493_170 [Microgenomates group bacterium Gr01-1014_93]|nr:MAG: hypothetical protein G01um101493_170 [Microgenomates group bacterium Gr01-1014_93]